MPPRTPAIARLFWRRSPETRTITRNGVAAFGMHYWSPDLGGLDRVDTAGKPVRFGWGYDPEDIGRIALFREADWVGDALAKELRLPDGSTRRLSLWERGLTRDLADGAGQATSDELAYHNEIDATAKERRRERRAAERREKAAREAAAGTAPVGPRKAGPGRARKATGVAADRETAAAGESAADSVTDDDERYTRLLAGFGDDGRRTGGIDG